ncbi:MAG: MliC family protein [Proteobacteria bacterium]|nr:MliC family protein [Pseudomonadota bacterium]
MSIAVIALIAASVSACVQQGQGTKTGWTPIPRPAPDEATPTGIAYACEGHKEVQVVYAKNRASVTLDKKTWRMEYQPQDGGFRYADTAAQWSGRDDLATLRESAGAQRPLAYNCRPVRRTT